MSDPLRNAAASVGLLASNVTAAAALYTIGSGAETAGWFVIMAGLNVFAIPLAVVVDHGLATWMWYLVVLHWVAGLSVAVNLANSDHGTGGDRP